MGIAQSKIVHPAHRETVSVTFQYGSINGPEVDTDSPTHEALITGTSLGGRMSAVRRFFSLLTTFDFLFTIFLWFVCAMLNGESTTKAFELEVVNYHIEKSLFDVVLLSAFRFILIILAYALFHLSHWCIVALTTATTGAFIIAKVFLYDWKSQTNPLVTVFLLMCSFIISWGEAWFLDFRVLPYEDKASLLLAKQVNERTALLTTHSQRTRTRTSSPCPSDIERFYSPQGSDTESDNEDNRALPATSLSEEDSACMQQAEKNLEIALSMLQEGDWRTDKIVGQDIIQSLKSPVYGKIFKFVGIINLAASVVFEELVHNLENYSWNPSVKLAKRLHMVGSNCDVVYVVASDGAGGLVSSRDFINTRIWEKRGNSYIIGVASSSHHNLPVQKGCIRGEQGPCVYVCTPTGDSSSCQLQWLLNTSLKGWVPQYLLNQALSGAMMDYVTALRRYADSQSFPL